MNIRCYIIDDEPDAVALLEDYVNNTPGLELCGSSDNPLEALDFLTSAAAPDITFADIDMRQLTGLELAGMVNMYTSVIFTTAYAQYALQAFEKEALDYLLKPIDYPLFLKSVQRVRRKRLKLGQLTEDLPADYFNIKSEIKGRMLRLRFEDVIYIEGAVNYVQIHTLTGKYMTYLTIREVLKYLPRTLFTRIHRSFVINLRFVKVIERNQVGMQNNIYLPLGDKYKQAFLENMDHNLLKSDRNA